MKNARIVAIFAAAALVATLGLAGCGSNQSASNNAAPSSSQPSSTASAPANSPSSTDSKAAPEDNAASTKDKDTSKPAANQTSSSYIGEDAAKKAALDDAGFSKADVTELEAELDADDAQVHYDVDFKAGGKEYDYEIDAVNGKVLNHSSEVDD